MSQQKTKIGAMLDVIEKNNLTLDDIEKKLFDFTDVTNVQKKLNQVITYMILKYPLQIGIISSTYNKYAHKSELNQENNFFRLSEVTVFCFYAKEGVSFSKLIQLWKKILIIK